MPDLGAPGTCGALLECALFADSRYYSNGPNDPAWKAVPKPYSVPYYR
ncbi:MAG: hypothetical protein V4528_08175 [Pseudomonadota bacterium]